MGKNNGKSLIKTGVTADGKDVIGGWFYMVTTYGVPLDMVVSFLDNSGHMPDWLDFYYTAIREGWHPERTIGRLRLVVADVYGPDFAETWLEIFNEKKKELEGLRNERKRECSGDSD